MRKNLVGAFQDPFEAVKYPKQSQMDAMVAAKYKKTFHLVDTPAITFKIAQLTNDRPLSLFDESNEAFRPVEAQSRNSLQATKRLIEQYLLNIGSEKQFSLAEVTQLKQTVLVQAFGDITSEVRKQCREHADILQYLWNSFSLLMDMLIQTLIKQHTSFETESVQAEISNHSEYQKLLDHYLKEAQVYQQKYESTQRALDEMIKELRIKRKEIHRITAKSSISIQKVNDIKNQYVQLQNEFIGMLCYICSLSGEQAEGIVRRRSQLIRDRLAIVKAKKNNLRIRKDVFEEVRLTHDEGILKAFKEELTQITVDYMNSPNLRSVFIQSAFDEFTIKLDGQLKERTRCAKIEKGPIEATAVGTEIIVSSPLKHFGTCMTMQDRIQMGAIANLSSQTLLSYLQPHSEEVATQINRSLVLKNYVKERFVRERVLELRVHEFRKVKLKDKRKSSVMQLVPAGAFHDNGLLDDHLHEGIVFVRRDSSVPDRLAQYNKSQTVRSSQNTETDGSSNNVPSAKMNYLTVRKEKSNLQIRKSMRSSLRSSFIKTVDKKNEPKLKKSSISKVDLTPLKPVETPPSSTPPSANDSILVSTVDKKTKFMDEKFRKSFHPEKSRQGCQLDVEGAMKEMETNLEAQDFDTVLTSHLVSLGPKEAGAEITRLEEFKKVADLYEIREEIQPIIDDVQRALLAESSKKSKRIINFVNVYKLLMGAYTRAYTQLGKGEVLKNLVLSLYESLELVYGATKTSQVYKRMVQLIVSLFHNKSNPVFESFLFFLGLDSKATSKKVTAADTLMYLNLLDRMAIGGKVTTSIDNVYTTMSRMEEGLLGVLQECLSPMLAMQINKKISKRIADSAEHQQSSQDEQSGDVRLNIFKISVIVVEQIIKIRETTLVSFQQVLRLFQDEEQYPLGFIKLLAFSRPISKLEQVRMFTMAKSICKQTKTSLGQAEFASICLKSNLLSFDCIQYQHSWKYKLPQLFVFERGICEKVMLNLEGSNPDAQKWIRKVLSNSEPSLVSNIFCFSHVENIMSSCLDSLLGESLRFLYRLTTLALVNANSVSK